MKNTNLTVKELRESLKQKMDKNLYTSLGIDKMKKQELQGLYDITCNIQVSTNVTNKDNNKKQRNKQKAVKDNSFDLNTFIVFHTKGDKSLVKFDFSKVDFIPKNLYVALKLSFKDLFEKGSLKWVEQNATTHSGYYVFNSKYNKVVENWRNNAINYKKGVK